MSYEYATPNEFAAPYPDWSGHPALENDEEPASTSTNSDSQTANYQEGSYYYAAGTGKYLALSTVDTPTQDARPRSMALADEEWLNVTISILAQNPLDLALPHGQTTASELPVNYDQEQVGDTQIPWIPMSDEEFRTLSAYMPVDSYNYQQAFMPLAQDQAPMEATYHNSTQDPQQFYQDTQAYQPCAAVMPPVQPGRQGHIEEAPVNSPEQRPADPPARVMRKRRARLLPPDVRPQPAPSEPSTGLRASRQKSKATRSLHYRDHVYKDQFRTVPSQAMVSVPSSSGHNSIDSSPSSLGLDSPFPSSRASPLSDTSVESNAVASAQIPTFHPAPSQAPTPPLFVPSVYYAKLARHEWAETFFRQPREVRSLAGGSVPEKHEDICCAWVIPVTWMSCHTKPSGQPREYMKKVSGRAKNGFFARTIEEFLRHLLAHREEERVMIENFNLEKKYRTWWNDKAIDAQAKLDECFPRSQKWCEGEKRPF